MDVGGGQGLLLATILQANPALHGQERTAAEYRALFAAAGFNLNRVIPTQSPLPAICVRLHGDDAQGAYGGLVEVAHSFGFTVENHAFDGETNGDCSHTLERIRIQATLEPTHRVKTLAYELAHALLHMDRSERALDGARGGISRVCGRR